MVLAHCLLSSVDDDSFCQIIGGKHHLDAVADADFDMDSLASFCDQLSTLVSLHQRAAVELHLIELAVDRGHGAVNGDHLVLAHTKEFTQQELRAE